MQISISHNGHNMMVECILPERKFQIRVYRYFQMMAKSYNFKEQRVLESGVP
jgi:hypothetical protein